MTAYSIPESVTTIGESAFEFCENLISITIPSNVTYIGDSAFEYCYNLEIVNFNAKNCTRMGGRFDEYHSRYYYGTAFEYCHSLHTVNIEDNVTNIPDWAFAGCKNLINISIPNNVISIGSYAFYDCESITTAIIGNNVKDIKYRAFAECMGLNNITIPESVTRIDDEAFYCCQNLKIVNFNAINCEYMGFEDSFIASREVFKSCYAIETINIGKNVINIPPVAFFGCSVTDIIIPNNVTNIGRKAFKQSGVINITIGENVTDIGEEAFSGCGLISINIPDSVTTIGEGAFEFCDSLTNITIPDSVISIGRSAFFGSNNLTDVYYGGSEISWNNILNISDISLPDSATIHYNSTGPIATNYTNTQSAHLWLNGNFNRETYLGIGQTFQSGIQAYPLEAYPTEGVTWHSTNPAVAAVSQKGLITGVTEGKANIYIITANGITSDAMTVVVTDLSKFSNSATATEQVSNIGYGSNYEWIIRNDNFLYWKAFVNNDTNALKYWFQNYLCAPLFDSSELKNLYSGECSVKRAKEILLSFISDTYDPAFKTVKKDLSYKIGNRAANTLRDYLDKMVDDSYGARLDALGEDNIIKAFDNGYESGIDTLSNYFEPDNPKKFSDIMHQWLATDTVSDCFSALSKVVNLRNTVSSIGNELMDIQVAAETNNGYCEMLDYLEKNCISSNVRRAAREIKNEINSSVTKNLLSLSASLAISKGNDKIVDWTTKNIRDTIMGSDFFVKLGYDMGIFVSNELLHASDSLKCGDNIRLLSYISVAMTSNITDIHNKFLTEQNPAVKEEYAKKLIQQYNLLILARKAGEENYYQTYKYNPANFGAIRKLFGWDDKTATYEQWYNDTMEWLDEAKGKPEEPKPINPNAEYKVASQISLMDNSAIQLASEGTPYTAGEFYALFADKAFADAVIYSLGADVENTDWNIITHEAVEQLDVLCSGSNDTITDITGISALPGLEHIDLSNQNIHGLPDEITSLENLKSINLYNNGLTEYPDILNEISSLESVGMGYNLLTEMPYVPDNIEIDVTGNLLNPGSYEEQRYLYCNMPIIYNENADIFDMITVKDMYGGEYSYNGTDLFVDGVSISKGEYIDLSGESISVTVNNSSNPNAQVNIVIDITETAEYTEDKFRETFPDERVRTAILEALGMDTDNVDYSAITDVSLAEISAMDISSAVDLTGIGLLKGLNSLTVANSEFEILPAAPSSLSNLQTLSLRGSKISSLSGISRLQSLDSLDISECTQLSDISEIKNIPKLESLYADGLVKSDILELVTELPNIHTLSVSGNQIEDIEPILGRKFNYLNIQGNYIDESVLESEYLEQLSENCIELSALPQINSLVSAVALNGDVADITIENETNTIFEDITLITAHYRNGQLMECVTELISRLDIDGVSHIEAQLSDVEPDDTVKCLIWSSMDGMIPVSRDFTI